MSFESAMASHLKAAGTVSAIVGTDIYKTACDNPEAGLARIEVVMNGGQGHNKHMTGVGPLTHRRGTVVCRQSTFLLAEVLETVVRKVLDGFVNGVLGTGGNTANVSRLSLQAPDDVYEPPKGGKDIGHPTRLIRFEAWLAEAT